MTYDVTQSAPLERPAYSDDARVDGGHGSIPTIEGVLNTLSRRRWLVLTVAMLGTAMAAVAGSAITARFTSVALIELEPDATSIRDLQVVQNDAGVSAAGETAVQTAIQRLSSRDLMRKVVDYLGLVENAELNPPLMKDKFYLLRLMGGAWQHLENWVPTGWLTTFGLTDDHVAHPLADALQQPALSECERAGQFSDFRWTGFAQNAPVDSSVCDESSRRTDPLDRLIARVRSLEGAAAASRKSDAAVSALAAGLQIRQQNHSYAIAIGFTSIDPRTAALVANTVVELYMEDQLQWNRANATEAAIWLGKRVAALRQEAEQAEAELEQYRVANNLVSERHTRIDDQQLADLSSQLITLRAELSGVRARLDYARQMGHEGQPLDTMLEVLSSPTIIELRSEESELSRREGELSATLGPRHPRILLLAAEKQKLSDEIELEVNRIVAQMQNEEQIMAQRVSALEASLDSAQSATNRVQLAETRLRGLERTAQASRRHYERFLDRYYDAQGQQEIVSSGVRVISPAMPPERPSTPRPSLFAVMGFTVSIVAGFMIALLLDRFDKGLRGDSDVRRILGAPRISIVPLLGRRQLPPHRYLSSRPLSVYAEAIREILTECSLDRERRSKVIAITSSVPEEGKTTLSISLAVCASIAKYRVMLIDLDLRRPAVLRELRQNQPRLGIVDYLMDGTPLGAIVTRDEEFGFDMIPMGRQHVDPTSLLTNDRMIDLLEDLRSNYDVIIVDSSPLLGITDARIFAHRADNVVFVVRWAITSRKLAQSAIRLLRRAEVNVTGVVLTQANMKQHARYGYGDTGAFYDKYQRYYQG